jgi:hypothetical protein
VALSIADTLAALKDEAETQGVPFDLARTILGKENFKDGRIPDSGNVSSDLVSPKGATGVMQIMPSTYSALVKQGRLPAGLDLKDPKSNIKAGVATLKESLDRTGDPRAAQAEYNGGTAARKAVQAGKEPPSEETRRYMADPDDQDIPSVTLQPGQTSKASERIVTKVRDPIGVAAILADQKAHSENIASLLSSFSSASDQASTSAANLGTAYLAAGDTQADAKMTEGDIAGAQGQKSQDIMETFGVNVNDPTSLVSQNRKQVATVQVAKAQLRDQYDRLDEISFLDNPLAWFGAQLSMSEQKRHYQALDSKESELNKQIIMSQTQAAAEKAVDLPNMVLETRRLAAQQAAVLRADAVVNASKALKDADQLTAAKMQTLFSMSQMDYGTRMQVAMKLLDTSTYTEGMTAQDKKLMDDLSLVNQKYTALGKPLMTPERFRGLTPAKRSELMEWGDLNGAYGTGPGNAFSVLGNINGLQGFKAVHPEAAEFLAQIKDSKEVKDIIATRSQTDPKFMHLSKEDQFAYAMDEAAQAWTQATRKDKNGYMGTTKSFGMNSLPESNPYRLQPVLSLSVPELKGNLLRDAVASQVKVAPLATVKDTDLVAKAVDLAAADPRPENIRRVAADAAKYFYYAQKAQSARLGFGLFSMPARDGDYVIAGTQETQLSRHQLQTTSVAEWENLLTVNIAAKRRKEMMLQAAEDPSNMMFNVRD